MTHMSRGHPPLDNAAALERAIVDLDASLETRFAAGEYRAFFDQAHAVRELFRQARLDVADRERLWSRLNRCTDAAKARQAEEFAVRRGANVALWSEQLATAESYAAALRRERDELLARGGSQAERSRWQGRADEKAARLADVETNIARLRTRLAGHER